MLVALSSLPSLSPLSVLAAAIPSNETLSKSAIRLIRARRVPLWVWMHLSWHVCFVLVGVRAPGPLVFHFGHAGHEEYPALTWHIRKTTETHWLHFQGGDITKKRERERERDGDGGVGWGVSEKGRGRGRRLV